MPFRFVRHAGLAIAPALLLSMLVSVSVSLSVQAHSPMTSVAPADGARLTSAPTTIKMRFRGPSRLIRFGLAAAEDGTDVALGDDHLMVEAADHTVTLPPLGAGSYVASWRAMGDDGHVIKGRFSFTIAPE